MTRLSQELDTARGLFDLLGDSIAGSPHAPRRARAVATKLSGPPSGGSWPRETLVATLSPNAAGLEVEVDPRVATSLIALGVELVADPSDATQIPAHLGDADRERLPHLDRARHARRRPRISCCCGAASSLRLCRAWAAAARANGAVLEFEPNARRFSLTSVPLSRAC